MPKRLPPSTFQLNANINYALRRLMNAIDSEAKKCGLTPLQHQALLALHGHPDGSQGVTIGQLRERLLMDLHATSQLVSRMVENGLLVTERSARDRRKVYVQPTDLGIEKLERVARGVRKRIKALSEETAFGTAEGFFRDLTQYFNSLGGVQLELVVVKPGRDE